jgi:hypothetical protein
MKGFLKRYRSPIWATTILCVLGVGSFALTVQFTLCGGPRARESVQRNACINNLRQIDGAKEQWALEHKKEAGDLIVMSEVDEYFKGGHPKCPADGVYRYRKVGDTPLCSVKGHTLE